MSRHISFGAERSQLQDRALQRAIRSEFQFENETCAAYVQRGEVSVRQRVSKASYSADQALISCSRIANEE